MSTGAGAQNTMGIRQNVIFFGFNPNDPPIASENIVDHIANGTMHEVGHLLTMEHADTGWCRASGTTCSTMNEQGNFATIMNGGPLNHAERSLFTGIIQPDEYRTLTLSSGQATTTQQYTVAPMTAASGLRTVHIVTSAVAGQRNGGRVEYWLDYVPPTENIGIFQGSFQLTDSQGNLRGLEVIRTGIARSDVDAPRDDVAENLSHEKDSHFFQPGETYANYDGRVTVHVDSMDDAGLTLTVTLTK
jgi:hypothetical protein